MKLLLKSRRGETLVEVLIALTVLVVGVMGFLRLLGVASVNNQITKERVIATNLAREGLEAVRNIRDTNWLRFGGERRICWNNLNPSVCVDDNPKDGVADDVIEHNQYYLASFDSSNYRWELDSVSPTERLDIADDEIANDEPYRLKINATNGLYNHTSGDDSVFFREVYAEYLDNDLVPIDNDEKANLLRITSRVEWYDRGKINDVTLTTIMSDYLGRRNHDY